MSSKLREARRKRLEERLKSGDVRPTYERDYGSYDDAEDFDEGRI